MAAIKRARHLQMRKIDRVTVNGKTSLGMAFKTDIGQSSWLPDQMLKGRRHLEKLAENGTLPMSGPTRARRIKPPPAVKSRIGAEFRANHPLSQVRFGSSLPARQ